MISAGLVLLRLFAVVLVASVASGVELKVDEPAAADEDKHEHNDIFHYSFLFQFQGWLWLRFSR